MKKLATRWVLAVAAAALLHATAQAQTIYVATNGTHDAASRFDTWAGAATNMHEAVGIATNGETVRVSNGVYRLTNQIVVATHITLQSVNGPDQTVLYRAASFGDFGLCRVSNANALVSGFTLTNGYLNGMSGAGLYLAAGTVSNCVVAASQSSGSALSTVYVSGGLLTGCTVSNNTGYYMLGLTAGGVAENCTIAANAGRAGLYFSGGGVARRCRIVSNRSTSAGYGPAGVNFLNGGRLENSLVYGNSAMNYVAGVKMTKGAMVHCTIAGNVAPGNQSAVGVENVSGVISNCIMYGNGIGALNDNYYGANAAVWYSCAPELAAGAQGNVTADPRFVNAAAADCHLALGSPSLDGATNLDAIADDLDGAPRPLVAHAGSAVRPDMGCYEKNGAAGALQVGFSGAPLAGFDSVTSLFTAVVAGTHTTIASWAWDFDGDGVYETNGTALATISHAYAPGLYSVAVRVTNSAGETAASTNLKYVVVGATNIYVSMTGGSIPPYASWTDAATNFHDAIGVALPGCTVWVTNGSYRLTNQLALYSGYTVRSVNGPADTTLWRDASFGDFRLLDIRDAGAVVSGLTLTNGHLNGIHGTALRLMGGAVSHCVITKSVSEGTAICVAYVGDGRFSDCVVSNNSGYHMLGVAGGGVVEDCTIVANVGRAGLYFLSGGVARRCRILGNRASTSGYGPAGVLFSGGGRLENSLVHGNSCANYKSAGVVMNGGGCMVNCTVAGNYSPGSGYGGVNRTTSGALTNCIVYDNGVGAANDNYYGDVSAVQYSCAPELTPDVQGNTTEAPGFDAAGGDLRLPLGSPCAGSGTNVWGADDLDLDGNPRVHGGAVDMGAYQRGASGEALGVAFSVAPASGIESVTSVFSTTLSGGDTNVVWWGWDFDNNGAFDRTGTGLAVVTNPFGLGRFSVSVRITNSSGQTASATNVGCVLVVSSNICVATNGGDRLPYAAWADAATNIHDALGVAQPGCTVWVSNGSYRVTNQLALYSAVAVRGVSGPEVTTVWRDAAFGDFRIFDIRDAGAAVSGLTVTNGYLSGVHGAAIDLTAGLVSNCVVAKSTSAGTGMTVVHVAGGLFTDCVVSNSGGYHALGVAAGGVVENCLIVTNAGRAGLYFSSGGVARRCRIVSNRSTSSGYGPAGVLFSGGGRLEDSLVHGNTGANYDGIGVFMNGGGCLANCTVVGNRSAGSGCGGINRTGGALTNCIVYGNGTNGNYNGDTSAAWYSCAPELTEGLQGNIAVDPEFMDTVAGDFRLNRASPCLNAGLTFAGMGAAVDLDGLPRVQQGAVDMGAYETPPGGGSLIIVR